MRFRGVTALFITAFLAACSSTTVQAPPGGGGGGGATGTPATRGPQDPGVVGVTPPAGGDVNPNGVAYPTANVGYQARKGNKAGNVIENYKFLGYPTTNGLTDVTQGLKPVSLADYYDPEAKNFKIIHIIVSGVWCTFCKAETDALVPLIEGLKSKKVVFLTALSEDIYHKPASQGDLDFWVKTHKTNFTQVLDPGNKQLGPFFDAAAIPWNANIDARTMELLSSGVGAPVNNAGEMDIEGEVQPWIDWVDHNEVVH